MGRGVVYPGKREKGSDGNERKRICKRECSFAARGLTGEGVGGCQKCTMSQHNTTLHSSTQHTLQRQRTPARQKERGNQRQCCAVLSLPPNDFRKSRGNARTQAAWPNRLVPRTIIPSIARADLVLSVHLCCEVCTVDQEARRGKTKALSRRVSNVQRRMLSSIRV